MNLPFDKAKNEYLILLILNRKIYQKGLGNLTDQNNLLWKLAAVIFWHLSFTLNLFRTLVWFWICVIYTCSFTTYTMKRPHLFFSPLFLTTCIILVIVNLQLNICFTVQVTKLGVQCHQDHRQLTKEEYSHQWQLKVKLYHCRSQRLVVVRMFMIQNHITLSLFGDSNVWCPDT